MYKWRVTWMESERGWGQDFWDTDYDSEEEAWAEIKEQDDKNPWGHVPDCYIRASGKPKQVWVDPPADKDYQPKHRKETS